MQNVLLMAGLDGNQSGLNAATAAHKEGGKSHVQKEENAVQAVLALLLMWKNPFTCAKDEPMSNITSGLVASPEVQNDMLCALERGEEHVRSFIDKRIVHNAIPFYDRVPQLKLLTFSAMAKAKSINVNGKDVIVRAD